MAIQFEAVVAKVQTLADGGLRFTFDVDEKCVVQAAELIEIKRLGVTVEVRCDDRRQPGRQARRAQ